MEDQDKRIQRYPKIFDNACLDAPSERACLHITQDILYIFRA